MGWFTNIFYSPKPPAVRHPQTPSSPSPGSSSIKKKETVKEEEKKAEDEEDEEDDNEEDAAVKKGGSEGSSESKNDKNEKPVVGASARDVAAAERAKRIEMEELAAIAGKEAAAKAAQRKVDEKVASLLASLDTPAGKSSSSIVTSDSFRSSLPSSSKRKLQQSEGKVQEGKEEEEPPPPPPPPSQPDPVSTEASSLSSPIINVSSPSTSLTSPVTGVAPQVTTAQTPSAINTTETSAPVNTGNTEVKPTTAAAGLIAATPMTDKKIQQQQQQPDKTAINGVTTPRPSSVDPSTLIYSPGAAGGEFERLFENMDLPGLPHLSHPSSTTSASSSASSSSSSAAAGVNALPSTLTSDHKLIDPRKASHQLLQIGLASAELPPSLATPAAATHVSKSSISQGSASSSSTTTSSSSSSTGVGVKGSLNSSAVKSVGGGGLEGTTFVLNGTLRVIIHRLAKEVQRRTEAIHQLGAEILTLRKDLREAKETLQLEQTAMKEAEDVLLAETLRDVAPSILESFGGYSRTSGEFNSGISVGEEGSKVATVTSARDLMNSLRRADPTGEMILPTVVRRLAVVAEKYVEQRRANALLVQEVRSLRSSSSSSFSGKASSGSAAAGGKPPLRPAASTTQPRESLPPGSLDGAATSRSMFDDVDNNTGGVTARGMGMLMSTSSSSSYMPRDEEYTDDLYDQLGSTLRHTSGNIFQQQQQSPFYNTATTTTNNNNISSLSSSSSSSSWNKIRGSVQAAQALKTASNFSSLLASGAIGIHPHEPVTAAVHAELMDAHSVALGEMERLKDDAAMAHSVINELRTAHQAVQRTLTQTQAKSESDKRDREKLRDAIKVQQSLISKLESTLQNEHSRSDELLAQAEEARQKEAESERRCRKLQLMLDDANEQLRDAIVSSNKHKKRAAVLREEQDSEARGGDTSNSIRRERGDGNRNYQSGDRKRYNDDDNVDENESYGRYKDRDRSRDTSRRPPSPPPSSSDHEKFEKTLQELNKQIADQARQLAQAQEDIQRSKRDAARQREEDEATEAKRRVFSDPLARSPGRQVDTRPFPENSRGDRGDPQRGQSSFGNTASNTEARRGLSVFSLSKLSTSINGSAAQRR